MSQATLEALINPNVIAVFGASPRKESVAGRVFRNLKAAGFEGKILPINPKHTELDGQPCYANLTQVPLEIDLVVIATPACSVPEILRDCGRHKVKAAIVLSAGFSAQDENGPALKAELVEVARTFGIRVLGPNCLGLIRPVRGMNATFSLSNAQAGSLALISQSGAICTAILDWAESKQIGFSLMASIGEASDIGFAELLDFLAQDDATRSILLYIEGINTAPSFLASLRAAAQSKPVIVIKSGRYAEGSRAATTHTGAMVGADDVFDAALRRAGVVRAMSIDQLFAAAQLLSGPHRVQGDRLAIVTNAGGPGVMATDCAVEQHLKLAELSPTTLQQLDQDLPAFWSRANPVDILGDAPPSRYADAVSTCLADAGVDGLLVMLTPQAMSDPIGAAEAVIAASQSSHKPVLTSWLGANQVEPARQLLGKHHLPTFPNPESAIEAFGFLVHQAHNQAMLRSTPAPYSQTANPALQAQARALIRDALTEQRALLNQTETRALLTLFGIPLLPMQVATTAEAAAAAAEQMGFPVALKILSPDITHKSDVNGIRLHLKNSDAVKETFPELMSTVRQFAPQAALTGVTVEKMYTGKHGRELLLGVSQDPVFGPILSFGAGGITVEIIKDQAIGLPPLDHTLAKALVAETRISRLLKAYRNQPAIQETALLDALTCLSNLVCTLPELKEMDINPLIADEAGVFALDARIVVGH